MPNKCPWCNSDKSCFCSDRYACGTGAGIDALRCQICYERQLARMQPVVDAAMEDYENKWCNMSHELSRACGKYKGMHDDRSGKSVATPPSD